MTNFLDLPITGILLAVFLIGGIAGIFLLAVAEGFKKWVNELLHYPWG